MKFAIAFAFLVALHQSLCIVHTLNQSWMETVAFCHGKIQKTKTYDIGLNLALASLGWAIVFGYFL